MKRLLGILILVNFLLSSVGLLRADENIQQPSSKVPNVVEQVQPPQPTVSPAVPGLKPDPSGANTGGTADIIGASANAPTKEDLREMAAS